MNEHPQKTQPAKRQGGGVRLLTLAVTAVVVTGGILFGVGWWQGRALRHVESLIDSGNYEQAVAEANDFLRSHPRDQKAIAMKARAFVGQGLYGEAIRLFKEVGVAENKDAHALAVAFLHRRQWTEALPYLEELIAREPNNPDVLHECAACRAKLGLLDGAIEMAKRFAEQPDMEARGHLLLGTLYQQRHNFEEAAKSWAIVLADNPEATGLQVTPEEFFNQYGRALYESGDAEQAAAVLQKGISIQPTAIGYEYLGSAMMNIGKPTEAGDAWESALQLKSTLVSPRVGLANIAIGEGNADKALEWLAPIAESELLTAGASFVFQRAYSLKGDPEAAKKWKLKADDLRKAEDVQGKLDRVLAELPGTFWALVIRAYRFAEDGNWTQAAALVDGLPEKALKIEFVSQLIVAINNRSRLPDVDLIPMKNN